MEAETETARGTEAAEPLAGRLADGDPSAPREVVVRHRAELVRYATALLRDAGSAEDAVQEAFSRAFDALGRYPEARIRSLSLRPWLYGITLNVVRNCWRAGGREVPVARLPEGVSVEAPSPVVAEVLRAGRERTGRPCARRPGPRGRGPRS